MLRCAERDSHEGLLPSFPSLISGGRPTLTRSAFEPSVGAETKGRSRVYFSDRALPKMPVSCLSPQAGAEAQRGAQVPHPTQLPGGYSGAVPKPAGAARCKAGLQMIA